ncbi:MAG: Rieske 2Fe-2S domain-containing protein [Taibaiella sp.]|nr:Rieske 2Fe-2S domain-containing protein [Taibaiella sp.]
MDFFVDPDIRKASTIDARFYTDQGVYDASKERIFANSWQFAGIANQESGAGEVFPFTLLEGCLDEPLMLTTDEAGHTRCLSNVCTHRGSVLVNEHCQLRNIKCPYHGRMFGLDGKFQSMPEFQEVQNFPTEADNLQNLPLERWGNMLFTTIKVGVPFRAVFGDMMARVSWFPMDKLVYRHDLSKEYHVDAHWALYCENYLEGFHIPFVHEGLNKELDFGSYTTELFRYSNLQLGIGKAGENCFELPETSVDYGKQVAAYYFWVFPNMMFNFYPWGLSLNVVQPQGIGKTRVSFLTYVCDESKLEQGAGSGLDKVEMEDEAIVAQVQRGVRSVIYSKGRFSPKREQGPHHFHVLLADFLNR